MPQKNGENLRGQKYINHYRCIGRYDVCCFVRVLDVFTKSEKFEISYNETVNGFGL